MVGHTRGTPEGFGRDGTSGSQPPPPPPSIQEILATQTELLRQLVQGNLNRANPHQQNEGEDLASGYQAFFGTHPPLFSKADEPLEADAWLQVIESKFDLLTVPCADANKPHFAAQQLRGPACIWWEIIVLCSQQIMSIPGKSFGLLSGHIIFQLALLRES